MKIQGGIIESVPVNATSARFVCIQFFFNENVSYPVWTCREPISLILGTRFSIQGTRIGSLKHLKKTCVYIPLSRQCNTNGDLLEKIEHRLSMNTRLIPRFVYCK